MERGRHRTRAEAEPSAPRVRAAWRRALAAALAGAGCAAPCGGLPEAAWRAPTDERFVFFGPNGIDVSGADGFFSLGYVAAYLDANPKLRILVLGHADGRGAADANRTLSLRRANSVRAALVSHGVAAERIDIGAPVEEARSSEQAVSRRADLYLYDPASEVIEKRIGQRVEIRRE
jgi:outer membrane protein OmpA-like peptidoglycan-associated protein